MDVVIANMYQDALMNLDTDIIKCLKGEFSVDEIVDMFRNFYYNRLIVDVTALKSYTDYSIFEVLAQGLDPDRIIFLLPEGSPLCTPSFLQHLISFGIYNFTTNVKGVAYLIQKPNTYQDVEKIIKMASKKKTTKKTESPKVVNETSTSNESDLSSLYDIQTAAMPIPGFQQPSIAPSLEPKQTTMMSTIPVVDVQKTKKKQKIVGVFNVTASAGATTLIYMMLKELIHCYGEKDVVAIEIDKNDFRYFFHQRMVSVKSADLKRTLQEYSNVKIVLVDLNGFTKESICDEVIYLIEPSTLKLNRLTTKNTKIYDKLTNKRVVLNQSVLQSNEVFNFENEAGFKVFFNIPPLNDRKRNSIISELLLKMELIKDSDNVSSGKIFGLFRR